VPSLLSGWQPACGAEVGGAGADVGGGSGGLLDDGAEDGPDDPLADALGDPDACDACAEAEKEAVGLLVLLLVTHPTTVMIITRASGGAAIMKAVRRQKAFGPSGLLPGGFPTGPRGCRPSGLSGLPGGCSSLIYSPKHHHEMKVTFRTSDCLN
jgi:hypothetical protein